MNASDVKIEGFKVEPGSLVVANGVGFFAFNTTSGWKIRHNVFQNNTIGAYPNSNGVEKSEFKQNCVRNNALPGAAGGNGLYSDQGLSNAEIEHNYFTGDDNAIVISPFGLTPPTQNVEISHNESVNDGAIAVFLLTPASMTIDHNKVVNPAGSGVRTDGLTNSDIDHNDVSGGGFSGISLTSTTFSHVGHNRARNFAIDGVRLNSNSNNNTVDHNRADDNTEAGLHALGGSMNNTIQENHMRHNTPDCQDDTIGTGTANTANFWIKDNGETESPVGICRKGK